MALLEISVQPTDTEAYITTSVTLDRRRWTFEFYKNSVDDAWYWDLINDSQEAVVEGEGLAMMVDLLAKFRSLDVPAGWLFVAEQGDGTGGRDPDQQAFRERRALLYYLEAE